MLLVDPASEKIQYNTRKGRISNLSTDRYSVNFVSGYLIASCFSPTVMFCEESTATHRLVSDVMCAISRDLNINFALECSSITQLGKTFYYTNLQDADILSLYSPGGELFEDLAKAVKF